MLTMNNEENVCGRCGKNDSGIVHSGTDGILLGVLDELHKICYDCGNKVMLGETVNEDRDWNQWLKDNPTDDDHKEEE